MNDRIVAIILAAGDSSRMGSPKALLRIEGRTFLDRLLFCYESVGISRYVVLGSHSSRIEKQIDLSSATVLTNPDPEQGPLSSLLIALEEASSSSALIVQPVDHPLVSRETIQSLIDTHKRLSHCILIPEFEGRRGHPILIPSKYYPDLRAAPLSEGARSVVRCNRASNHIIPVKDPGILLNIDTQEDYRQITGYPQLCR